MMRRPTPDGVTPILKRRTNWPNNVGCSDFTERAHSMRSHSVVRVLSEQLNQAGDRLLRSQLRKVIRRSTTGRDTSDFERIFKLSHQTVHVACPS